MQCECVWELLRAGESVWLVVECVRDHPSLDCSDGGVGDPVFEAELVFFELGWLQLGELVQERAVQLRDKSGLFGLVTKNEDLDSGC